MTEQTNLEKEIAEDLGAVLKEARAMGYKEIMFSHIPLVNVETIVRVLLEYEQYRAIGTVEEIIAGLNDGVRTLEQSGVVIEAYMSKLEEYQSLGTVEELQSMKEKAEPKKIRIGKRYNKGYRINACFCDSCDNFICFVGEANSTSIKREYHYCTKCGQHLDWELGGEDES